MTHLSKGVSTEEIVRYNVDRMAKKSQRAFKRAFWIAWLTDTVLPILIIAALFAICAVYFWRAM